MTGVFLSGYGSRRAMAGGCYYSAVTSTYLCSSAENAATDVTQVLTGAPLVITTIDGFGIDTRSSGGDALTLSGTGGLTFTDAYVSQIYADDTGINATNDGSGSLSVTSTGFVSAKREDAIFASNGADGEDLTIEAYELYADDYAVNARNYGSGALSITTTGTVEGNHAIYALNYGSDLTVNTIDVTGYDGAIEAINKGSGLLSIE
ncbi:hypothetical protein, partial [Oricola sp.]|uniref:hypothetical protein n=1 Tax=Oricola sp. TaxID=1979950 RepID=UPI0025EAC69E